VRVARILGAVLIVVLMLAVAAWLGRRPLAREAVTLWLERRGVAADVRIDRLELDGMVGAVVLGDPDDTQVTAPRVEVDWTVGAPWRAGGLGPTPTRVRLVDAEVKARWTGRRLSFGTLDPLIDEFARRPARTDQVGPLILLENATVRLDSDWGRTTLLGDARVADGQLASLEAVLPAADYRNGDRFARGVGGRLELSTLNGRTSFDLVLETSEARLAGVEGAGLKLSARGSASWPDLGARSADGPVRLNADVSLDRVATGGWAGRGLTGTIAYAGQAEGGGPDLKLDGRTTLDLRAAALSGPLDAASPRLVTAGSRTYMAFPTDGPLWRLDGPLRFAAERAQMDGHRFTGLNLSSADLTLGGRGDAVEATGPVVLTAASLNSGALTLTGVSSRARLDAVFDGPARLRLTGEVTARGGRWPLLGVASRDDVPEMATLKRALSDFSLTAPGVDLRLQPDGTTATLTRAAVVQPRSGGRITVQPAASPILSGTSGGAPGGDFDVTLAGGGLPEARLRFADWRLTPGGFRSDVSGRVALDFGIGRGVVLDGAGRLETTPSGVTFTTSRCTPLSVARLELGENDVTEVTGALCPVGRPLFAVTDGGWRVDGRLRDVGARAPFLALRFADAEGPLAVRGTPGGLVLNAGIESARIVDATDPVRFLPLTATGRAGLADDRWAGSFDLAREGTPVGALTLAHDGVGGVGGVDVVTRDLIFAEGGLQPSDLTPLGADLVRAPVSGRARFDGSVDWNPQGGTSGGLLTLDGLNFDSPAGPVEGLSGAITLTSLAPLETAPDQAVTIERVLALTDGTDVRVTFDLDKSALNVDAASVGLAGGSATLEPLSLPLEPGRPFSGVLRLDRIQLGDLISATGLHDKLMLDAVISGRLPFTWTPGKGATIQGGGVYSVQPGRLSLRREALDGLETAGGGGDVPPNVVQDMAYQAMENLAFEELTASLDSLDGGRLAARFHVLGRHDPPERQELRLTWIELFRRDFLGRELPLPSDTGIDLTLDVNLNINQLISDLIALNAARNGEGNRD
jgi:hypothetical protein